jgi:hypothetical protein
VSDEFDCYRRFVPARFQKNIPSEAKPEPKAVESDERAEAEREKMKKAILDRQIDSAS